MSTADNDKIAAMARAISIARYVCTVKAGTEIRQLSPGRLLLVHPDDPPRVINLATGKISELL